MINPSYWSSANHRPLCALLEGPPGLAAFDFDFTLIQGDQGEALMNEIILGGLIRADEEWFWEGWPASINSSVPALRADFEKYRSSQDRSLLTLWMDGLLNAYETVRMHEGTEIAYRWSSICFAGFSEETLGAMSLQVFSEHTAAVAPPMQLPSGRSISRTIRIRPGMHELVQAMVRRGWEVVVVTASPRIPIAVVAPRWGISRDSVLGMNLQLMEDGRMGPSIVEPYPCAAGKVTALRQHTSKPLRFAAGDSMMDVPLLEAAEFALVMDRGVQQLREHATARGWLVEPQHVIP